MQKDKIKSYSELAAITAAVASIIGTSYLYFGIEGSPKYSALQSLEQNRVSQAPITPKLIEPQTQNADPKALNTAAPTRPLDQKITPSIEMQILERVTNIQSDIVVLRKDISQINANIDELKGRIESEKVKRVEPTKKAESAPVKQSKPSTEFTIIGASAEQLLISQGNTTKKIVLGTELPNGAIFKGFDGKQIITSAGTYLVQ